MSSRTWRREFQDVLSERILILVSIVVDALFLLIWRLVLRLFDHFSGMLNDHHSAEWEASRTIFAVSTMVLILLYIFWDLKIVYCRLRSRHDQLEEQLRKGGV